MPQTRRQCFKVPLNVGRCVTKPNCRRSLIQNLQKTFHNKTNAKVSLSILFGKKDGEPALQMKNHLMCIQAGRL